MTVAELIEKLKEFDPTLPVLDSSDGHFEITAASVVLHPGVVERETKFLDKAGRKRTRYSYYPGVVLG